MSKDSTRFWSRGRGAFLKALSEEENEALTPLKRSLDSASDPDARRNLQEQIKQIKQEFRGKRTAARSSLFSKG